MIIESICPIEKCTGCGACFEVCAHSAINMIPDAEGFLRPIIDSKLCVGCGLCQVTCPVNTPFTGKMNKPLKVYSGWSLDEDIIAGLMIKIDDNVIDMSLRNRIDKLSKSLMLK